MEELVKYIVQKLVDNEEAVNIESSREGDEINIIVTVAPEDVGKVIGRNGKVAGSIRTIVKSASMGTGKRFIVKIGERD